MIPKFRAFNKKTKKIYGVDGFKVSERRIYRCSLADDEFRPGHMETIHFVEDNLDDYILMQLAHDDNTIYDKDIIIDCDSGEVGVVFYDDEDCAWKVQTDTTLEWLYNWLDCPVLGNVYENPELLEGMEDEF